MHYFESSRGMAKDEDNKAVNGAILPKERAIWLKLGAIQPTMGAIWRVRHLLLPSVRWDKRCG